MPDPRFTVRERPLPPHLRRPGLTRVWDVTQMGTNRPEPHGVHLTPGHAAEHVKLLNQRDTEQTARDARRVAHEDAEARVHTRARVAKRKALEARERARIADGLRQLLDQKHLIDQASGRAA